MPIYIPIYTMAYVWDRDNKDTYNNRYGRYKYDRQYAFIARHFRNRRNVLDIAGGSGRFALPLYELCQDITVADLSEEALALLGSRNDCIKTIQGDFMTLPLEGPYSFILCIEALSYFTDYDAFFAKVSQLLDREGRFVFLMVNPESWRSRLREFNSSKTPYDEITVGKLRSVLAANGLAVDDMEGFNWMPLPLSWSDSPLIGLFAALEKTSGLSRYHNQSPWLMVAVRKQ